MKLTANLDKATWAFDFDNFDFYNDYSDIKISFVKNSENFVSFDNLSFGIQVFFNDDILGEESFPKGNSSYVGTDQPYLETIRLFGFRPNREFLFHVWAENAGVFFEESINVFIPIPEQPYESWTWDDELIQWLPPFPPPDEDKVYDWNEDTQSWYIST